jgi:hypothetical protein
MVKGPLGWNAGGPFPVVGWRGKCEHQFLTELYRPPYDIVGGATASADIHPFTESHGDLSLPSNAGARTRIRRKARRRSLFRHESQRRRTAEPSRRHRHDRLLRDCEWNIRYSRKSHRGAPDYGVKERGGSSSPYGGPPARPVGVARFCGFRGPHIPPCSQIILPDRKALERRCSDGNRLTGRIRQ